MGDQDERLIWKRRLTWATTAPGNDRLGRFLIGERLVLKVDCPRCKTSLAAAIWRRFDYFGHEHPVYFTKCRRCLRRTAIDRVEVAFLLLDAGLANPLEVVPDLAHPVWGVNSSLDDNDIVSIPAAKKLLLNYERAFGKKHLLTSTARSILADAVGNSGDVTEAVRMYQQILVDEEAAFRPDHPAVLANRYRAAMWTAKDRHPSPALVALKNLLVDQEQESGPDDPNTLVIRASIAELMAVTGDREEAIAVLRQVREDQMRVLGPAHPTTEATRKALAKLLGE